MSGIALCIFPSTVPTNTVAQDQEDVGGGEVGAPTQHTFKMKSMGEGHTTCILLFWSDFQSHWSSSGR
jgi:hypothetical protein